ncbi:MULTISPECIES: hypothetical protein [unclassified Flavobacterium]|uniref:hypothetical protein n=1 Tax=unclassified Flavobacterium TaxID=196869 RepID=UPI003F93981A
MTSKNQFKEIILKKEKLLLRCKTNEIREYKYSDLENIFIKVNKASTIQELGAIALLLLIVRLSLNNLPHDLVLVLPLIIIITLFVRVDLYKSYELTIKLKNGTFLKRKVKPDLLQEEIATINNIRQEIFDCKIRSC